ncbi:ComEA family DNA-binding protein [Ectopseudomonas hydrolytica]|uniref:ComEA family DNA-binding protein n=1 Tax=Ectopseudomonas hydrolytica TaxID=2493633 RepID=UPI00027868E4|nr:helix-hairpin-helix repeat-containing competence protein ComEA [Pseudomonas mendocina DLHK]
MLKARLSTLLFAVLASLSVAAAAAESPKTESAKPAAVQSAQVVTINLNTADAATLQKELAGIGATKAQAIVAYREEHGNFASVDELLEVKGIGPATLEKNRDKLSVN